MMKTTLLAATLVLAVSGVARAGGQESTFGVGAEYQINGTGGVSVNFDAGMFHVGGFVGYYDPGGPSNSFFDIGARFFYHVHSTAMSDFGVGASVGILSIPPMGGPPAPRETAVYIEPGAQIRMFVASNVALSFSLGLVIGVADAEGVGITGQGVAGSIVDLSNGIGFSGGAGVHYYFF